MSGSELVLQYYVGQIYSMNVGQIHQFFAGLSNYLMHMQVS